jgi:hypothetical protein
MKTILGRKYSKVGGRPSIIRQPVSSGSLIEALTFSHSNYEGPVSSGIPLPIGLVTDISKLRLVNGSGDVSSQFDSLAQWPDGSEKSVLLSTIGYPGTSTLQYSDTENITTSGITVTDGADIVVDTGYAQFTLNKSTFTWLNSAVVQGTSLTSGSVSITGSLNGLSITSYSIFTGPLKAVINFKGTTFSTWLTFYAGSAIVDTQFTLIDPNPSSSSIVVSGVDFFITTPILSSGVFGGDSDARISASVPISLFQDGIRTFNMVSKNVDHALSFSGSGTGTKATGWVCAGSGSFSIYAGIKWFWQNYPNLISINGSGVLRISVQPSESSTHFYSPMPGVAKTHFFRVEFCAAALSNQKEVDIRSYLQNPTVRTSTTFMAESEVLGPLKASDSSDTAWNNYVAAQYICSSAGTNCSIYAFSLGKRDFGDYELGYSPSTPNYGNNHYEDPHGWINEYCRQGIKTYLDFAIPKAIHHYDIDVMHTTISRYPGAPAGKIHWHGGGDDHQGETIEVGHIVPGGIDEYYLLTGDPRSLEVSREQGNWVKYETEIGTYRIAIEKVGDSVGLEEYERGQAWPLYTVVKTYESTGDIAYWNAATILIQNLIDWWKMPQDIIVFNPAITIDTGHTPEWNSVYFLHTDWTAGNGYFLSTIRTDNCSQTSEPLSNYAYQDHVPVGWMMAYLATAIIRYLEHLKRIGGTYSASIYYRGEYKNFSVDRTTIELMLAQTTKIVVDHCWMGAAHRSVLPWLSTIGNNTFVYTCAYERSPYSHDGEQQLPFVLNYVSKLPDVSPTDKAVWENIVTILRTFAESGELYPGYGGAVPLWNMPYLISAT